MIFSYYAASSGNSLLTFRDNLSVPALNMKMGPTGCHETSARNYHELPRKNSENRSSNLFRGGGVQSRTIPW